MTSDRQFNSQTFGESGFTFTDDTSAVTGGHFFALYVVTDTTFTAFHPVNSSDMAGKSLPAGAMVYGNFTAYTLASGSVIAYKASI